MDAVPVASVSAVPDAGTSVASVPALLKVTTTLGTKFPDGSLTVAVTLAALLAVMLVTVLPVTGSVRAIEMLPFSLLKVVSPLPLTHPPNPRSRTQQSSTKEMDRKKEFGICGVIAFKVGPVAAVFHRPGRSRKSRPMIQGRIVSCKKEQTRRLRFLPRQTSADVRGSRSGPSCRQCNRPLRVADRFLPAAGIAAGASWGRP